MHYCPEHIVSLVQECNNSSAWAVELLQPFTKPVLCTHEWNYFAGLHHYSLPTEVWGGTMHLSVSLSRFLHICRKLIIRLSSNLADDLIMWLHRPHLLNSSPFLASHWSNRSPAFADKLLTRLSSNLVDELIILWDSSGLINFWSHSDEFPPFLCF